MSTRYLSWSRWASMSEAEQREWCVQRGLEVCGSITTGSEARTVVQSVEFRRDPAWQPPADRRHEPRPGIAEGHGYPCPKMRLDAGRLRQVTARRARKLKKRGEPSVRWSADLGWYTWRP